MLRSCTLMVVYAIFQIAFYSPAYAVSYAFCITRKSDASVEKFGAKYNFGDIDPGKEAARVLVSQKYKQADTTNVGVVDYDPANCGPIREEANVTMTSDQLKELDASKNLASSGIF